MKSRSVSRLPRLLRKFKPSFAEVDHYARLIMQHEQRPPSSLRDCMHEAEIQLWTIRSLFRGRNDDSDGSSFAGA